MPVLRSRLILALTLGACQPSPRQEDAAAYAARMAPVFTQDEAVSRQVLELAEQVRAGKLDASGLAARVEQEILPAARQVASAARAVTPATPALSEPHRRLVESWTARSDAYADLTRAFHAGDLTAFDAASKADLQARDAAAAARNELTQELSRWNLPL